MERLTDVVRYQDGSLDSNTTAFKIVQEVLIMQAAPTRIVSSEPADPKRQLDVLTLSKAQATLNNTLGDLSAHEIASLRFEANAAITPIAFDKDGSIKSCAFGFEVDIQKAAKYLPTIGAYVNNAGAEDADSASPKQAGLKEIPATKIAIVDGKCRDDEAGLFFIPSHDHNK